jgi:hypothetical protein
MVHGTGLGPLKKLLRADANGLATFGAMPIGSLQSMQPCLRTVHETNVFDAREVQWPLQSVHFAPPQLAVRLQETSPDVHL